MAFDLDAFHALGKQGLSHLLTYTWVRGLEVSIAGLASHKLHLLIAGTIWDPVLEPSPPRVPYIKVWSCPALREAKPCWVWMLWEDVQGPWIHCQQDLYFESCLSWTMWDGKSGWRGGITAG